MFGLSICVKQVFFVLCVFSSASSSPNDVTDKSQPTYFISTPRRLYPTMVFNVVVFILSDEMELINVRTSIHVNDQELVFASQEALPSVPLTLPLKIPFAAGPGNYSVQVLGLSGLNKPVFFKTSYLQFSPRFLSVSIQTSRPIYRSGQTVHFRLLVLQTDLCPFDGAVDIFVIDPDEIIMKRWVSYYTNNGVATLYFTLPKLVKSGVWKIRTVIHGQVDECKIQVELYYPPMFEVEVWLPPYIKDSELELKGSISGMLPSQELVHANTTVDWLGYTSNITTPVLLYSEHIFIKGIKQEIFLPMNRIFETFGTARGVEVELRCKMTELFKLEIASGFCRTRIVSSEIQLSFLSPSLSFYIPGMAFRGHVLLHYENHERVPADVLKTCSLKINALADGIEIYSYVLEGSLDTFDSFENFTKEEAIKVKYLAEGIVEFKFLTPSKSSQLEISAALTDESGTKLNKKLISSKQHSPSGMHIFVWTTTENAVVDDYAIFHVESNFRMSNFKSLILSKGSILRVAEHEVNDIHPTITTVALPISSDMAPVFQLIVFTVNKYGNVIADGILLPVNGFNRYEMSMEVNLGKDIKGERVEIRVSGDEGAYIAFQAQRSSSYNIHAGNELSISKVADSFLSFENASRQVNKMVWQTDAGFETVYFSNKITNLDAKALFDSVGVVIFTDAILYRNTEANECKSGVELPCLHIGCYTLDQRCDQIEDCFDNTDELNCFDLDFDDYEFRVSRMSRNIFLYDMEEGDWGRREIKKNDHEGVEFESLKSPSTADDWYFVAFSVSTRFGFSILPPLEFSTKKPLMASINGPSLCKRGEQISLQIFLRNTEEFEMFVTIILHESSDYKFVHVEENGVVSSYGARLSSGQHQLLIYLLPQSQEHVDIPVAPVKEQGEVIIKLSASTQAGRKDLHHKITVLPEGGLIKRHTSVFLDLKNRALVLRYLNIIVEESPIVPYQPWRRYIYGSPKASLSFTSLIIGPISPEEPISLKSLLDRESKSAETSLFELSANIWTLHYLRLTNQLDHEFMKTMLDRCSLLFADVLFFYNKEGFFSNWNMSAPSIWLTSWALRSFKHGSYADWEYSFYIEPKIFNRSISWLLKFQQNDGSFSEFNGNIISMNPHLGIPSSSRNESIFILTAHVLISLVEVAQMVDGALRSAVLVAYLRARAYLERSLTSQVDPYSIAIASYALFLSESAEREVAYQMLLSKEYQNNDGLEYWSREKIPSNPIKLENQRPYSGPLLYHENDSLAVEATSWALLVFLLRDGVTDKVERIVQWLISVRMTSSGSISTFDTVVSLQALTEYAFRSRILELTDISILVNLPTSNDEKHRFHLGNSSHNKYHSIMVNKVWGHANIVARGAGFAIAQMDVSYGIDYEALKDKPSLDIFQLNVTEYYSTERNKTHITIQSCFRYTRSFPKVSGAAVLEVELPTGYFLVESEAVKIAESGIHPTLRDAHTVEGKTIWLFDFITPEWTCFNHTVFRWYPVANISLFRQALLYESLAREHFVHTLFNSTPLYLLSICEVCGSYQCPYCPFYNSAHSWNSLSCLILLIICFSLKIVLN